MLDLTYNTVSSCKQCINPPSFSKHDFSHIRVEQNFECENSYSYKENDNNYYCCEKILKALTSKYHKIVIIFFMVNSQSRSYSFDVITTILIGELT